MPHGHGRRPGVDHDQHRSSIAGSDSPGALRLNSPTMPFEPRKHADARSAAARRLAGCGSSTRSTARGFAKKNGQFSVMIALAWMVCRSSASSGAGASGGSRGSIGRWVLATRGRFTPTLTLPRKGGGDQTKGGGNRNEGGGDTNEGGGIPDSSSGDNDKHSPCDNREGNPNEEGGHTDFPRARSDEDLNSIRERGTSHSGSLPPCGGGLGWG